MTYACIVKMSGKLGLLAIKDDKSWSIHGFESLGDGIRYFEDAYNQFHRRSFEASASATLNWLYIQPSIIALSIPQVEELVEERIVMNYRTVAGSVNYIPLKPEAIQLWEQGSKPNLIERGYN